MTKFLFKINQFFLHLSWSDLSTLAKNRVVNRTYIYLIIVPLIAKLFSKVESPLKLNFGEKIIELNIELPFNWVLFYLSALCFSLGTLIYYWKSPNIIKQNDSFGDFSSSKKTFAHVLKYNREMSLYFGKSNSLNFLHKITIDRWEKHIADKDIQEAINFLNDLVEKYSKSIDNKKKIGGLLILLYKQRKNYPEESLNASFWILFNYGNTLFKKYIYLSFAFFILGLAAILFVIAESMITVTHLVF